MPFKITFQTDVDYFDARLDRDQALAWLRSQNLGGVFTPSSGTSDPLDSLADERLAHVLAVATQAMLKEMRDRDAALTIRNEPDDEPLSWVSVRAQSISAAKVRHYEDDELDEDDGASTTSERRAQDFPFSEQIGPMLEGFDEEGTS